MSLKQEGKGEKIAAACDWMTRTKRVPFVDERKSVHQVPVAEDGALKNRELESGPVGKKRVYFG